VKRSLASALAVLAMSACGVSAPAAPPQTFAVGVRTVALDRGPERPLPTTVWYPAVHAGRDAPLASGRFPLVLYSHGLHSLPEWHAPIIGRWVAAGFVLAAPAYPHTRADAARFSRADVRNQPADAWHVARRVLALAAFAGHLDPERIGAAGHSAGGYTTAGLFTAGHDRRLRAGIIIAGGGAAGAFAGPPAELLFVHGSADRTVPITTAQAAYERVGWPKAFLTLPGQDHGAYLSPDSPEFNQVAGATTAFFRRTLLRDRSVPQVAGTTSATP
jgi:dienelactone hydrolase